MSAATDIHPSAVIEPGAELGPGVVVGPFCHIGPAAKIHDNTKLHSHVVVMGRTTLGAGSEVYPGTVLGAPPQDIKYKNEPTSLEIGANAMIREHVTMHVASVGGDGVTHVGHSCTFMVGAHVAHDCKVEDRVMLINHAVLGGHVHVGEGAVIGGNSAVHQYVRVGMGAMIGGMSGIEGDVIPYGMAKGDRAWLQGLNWVGLERRGFTPEQIKEMRRFYKELFVGTTPFADRLAAVRKKHAKSELVKPILDFLAVPGHRELCRPQ